MGVEHELDILTTSEKREMATLYIQWQRALAAKNWEWADKLRAEYYEWNSTLSAPYAHTLFESSANRMKRCKRRKEKLNMNSKETI